MDLRKGLFAFSIVSMFMVVFWFYGNRNFRESPPQLFPQNSVLSPPSNGDDTNTYVLLLAYPRSGSTFTGELLSSHPDAFYLFEPSYEYVNARHITDVQKTISLLNNIFHCHNGTLEMLDSKHKGQKGIGFFYHKVSLSNVQKFHNLSGVCQSSKVHVIKTIRLSVETAGQLVLEKPELNLKIVHLVRDPRAMVNSLNQLKDTWSSAIKSKAANCDSLRKDLIASQTIPSKNYIRVRYEDIASNVLDTTARVYNFIGLPLSDTLATYISNHTRLNKVPQVERLEYYATYRGKQFNPNKWNETLSAKRIKEIETSCKDVIELLGYGFS